jgi:RimJ/RimL family protein N-acetyltransferase
MNEGKTEKRERVYLRTLRLDDLARIHRWHNDSGLYANLGQPRRFVSLSAAEQWLREKMSFSERETALAICLTESEEHIGNVYLKHIDWIARRAELHLFIGNREHRSHGHGRSVIRQVVQHAFQDLGLQRLHLSVLASNTAAIKAYEGCGFQIEGRMRRHAFNHGRYEDMLLMGLCKEDDAAPP